MVWYGSYRSATGTAEHYIVLVFSQWYNREPGILYIHFVHTCTRPGFVRTPLYRVPCNVILVIKKCNSHRYRRNELGGLFKRHLRCVNKPPNSIRCEIRASSSKSKVVRGTMVFRYAVPNVAYGTPY